MIIRKEYYNGLKRRALAENATQEDINNLGAWFREFGDQHQWDGESWVVDAGLYLYPVYDAADPDFNKDRRGITGYTFSDEYEDRFPSTFYAVQSYDNDSLDYGSFDYDEAIAMLEEQGEGWIAVMKGTVDFSDCFEWYCEREIRLEDGVVNGRSKIRMCDHGND